MEHFDKTIKELPCRPMTLDPPCISFFDITSQLIKLLHGFPGNVFLGLRALAIITLRAAGNEFNGVLVIPLAAYILISIYT